MKQTHIYPTHVHTPFTLSPTPSLCLLFAFLKAVGSVELFWKPIELLSPKGPSEIRETTCIIKEFVLQMSS